jgi:hypothetical protein
VCVVVTGFETIYCVAIRTIVLAIVNKQTNNIRLVVTSLVWVVWQRDERNLCLTSFNYRMNVERLVIVV